VRERGRALNKSGTIKTYKKRRGGQQGGGTLDCDVNLVSGLLRSKNETAQTRNRTTETPGVAKEEKKEEKKNRLLGQTDKKPGKGTRSKQESS